VTTLASDTEDETVSARETSWATTWWPRLRPLLLAVTFPAVLLAIWHFATVGRPGSLIPPPTEVWLELQAMAWNRPELRERVARVNAEWRVVLTEAFTAAMKGYGLDRRRFPVEAVVSLVITCNEGIMLERLSGVSDGQAELLRAIDRWLQALEREREAKG